MRGQRSEARGQRLGVIWQRGRRERSEGARGVGVGDGPWARPVPSRCCAPPPSPAEQAKLMVPTPHWSSGSPSHRWQENHACVWASSQDHQLTT